jgi:cellobiose-specific phosphotransferase system component IIA
MLVGRLVGLLQFGAHAARSRQLAAIRQAVDGSADARTLRIDEAHERLARPHRQAPPAPLKRSA